MMILDCGIFTVAIGIGVPPGTAVIFRCKMGHFVTLCTKMRANDIPLMVQNAGVTNGTFATGAAHCEALATCKIFGPNCNQICFQSVTKFADDYGIGRKEINDLDVIMK